MAAEAGRGEGSQDGQEWRQCRRRLEQTTVCSLCEEGRTRMRHGGHSIHEALLRSMRVRRGMMPAGAAATERAETRSTRERCCMVLD